MPLSPAHLRRVEEFPNDAIDGRSLCVDAHRLKTLAVVSADIGFSPVNFEGQIQVKSVTTASVIGCIFKP